MDGAIVLFFLLLIVGLWLAVFRPAWRELREDEAKMEAYQKLRREGICYNGTWMTREEYEKKSADIKRTKTRSK